ncbi:MAG: aminoglycoside phosphotransferase family protein [Bacteroidales bacterium]
MDPLYSDLLTAFGLEPETASVSRIGRGHIHDTYLVERKGKSGPPLVLQKMNQYVFRDIGLLMKNIEQVTAHIAYKNRKAGKDPAKHGILLLEAEEGKSWIGNDDSGYWRMCWFIEDQVSFEVAENERIAFEGGKAIAHFQWMLADLEPERIGDTIPQFHDLATRNMDFEKSMAIAGKSRREKAADLIRFTKAHLPGVRELYTISEKGNFPVRLTHNDTKFNNILFNRKEKVTCMIDLDTVMKGYSWFDFGDALRTCASMAPEDEADTGKIGFRINIFEAFARGFLSEGRDYLTSDEISVLHRAPMAFAFMQGMRFLTDYLNGDVYYKTVSEDDNYRRTLAQYVLMERMEELQGEMAEIIEKVVAGQR